jgi:uncharacterized integral membrane protein
MPSKRTWKMIGLGIVALLIVIMIFLNRSQATFNFFGMKMSMPLFLLLFLTLVIGVVLGVLGDRYLLKK